MKNKNRAEGRFAGEKNDFEWQIVAASVFFSAIHEVFFQFWRFFPIMEFFFSYCETPRTKVRGFFLALETGQAQLPGLSFAL
jgi:hypothetical protein